MADVGEEAALDLVEFAQLLVVLLKLAAVLIELKPQGELAEAEIVEEIVPADYDDAGQRNEVKVSEENAGIERAVFLGQVGDQANIKGAVFMGQVGEYESQVHAHHRSHCKKRF